MPSGGGAVSAAPAAGGGGAPAADAEKKEEKEEEKVCVLIFSTLPLYLILIYRLYRKSPTMIWALVCSIRIKLLSMQCLYPPASYSTMCVGQRLSEYEEWLGIRCS